MLTPMGQFNISHNLILVSSIIIRGNIVDTLFSVCVVKNGTFIFIVFLFTKLTKGLFTVGDCDRDSDSDSDITRMGSALYYWFIHSEC